MRVNSTKNLAMPEQLRKLGAGSSMHFVKCTPLLCMHMIPRPICLKVKNSHHTILKYDV